MSEREFQSSSESSDEEGWLDTNSQDDEEPLAVTSLLDDRVFADATSMVAYCKAEHGFDFLAVRDRLDLDFYGSVKLINFIRQRVQEGLALPAEISAIDFAGDGFLKPVLNDDALIVSLDSLPEPQPQGSASKAQSSTGADASSADSLEKEYQQLRSELESLTRQFENYRLAVSETLDQRWGVDGQLSEASKEATDAKQVPKGESEDQGKSSIAGGTDYYFESYSHSDIHETMLKDAIRTDAYRDFIYANKHLFAGKTVLDIGCGTGILSMFCAKAGAKLVIAVDRSEIINKARENIFHNGLSNQITCLKGLIEEVTLPVDQVDIIVSEWMGYALLYEAMLPSVLYARDKYLAPDGLLVPSHASLFIAPVSDSEYICDSITFWRDVYGFDMKAMQAGIYEDARMLVMPEKTVAGSMCMFKHLDLHTVKVEDLVFTSTWTTMLSQESESLDGFLVWFDIYFGTSRTSQIEPVDASSQAWIAAERDRVAFTTGPFGKATHWMQCLLLDKEHSKPIEEADSREVSGQLSFVTADDNPRALTLRVKWVQNGQQREQSWNLR
ncbi:Ribosomal protein arginine N-methyltransferase rmt3 [Sporothrix epigloea]|uniref:type I protein arginine methyltransferase n=1 Tax=Sporothrix epigloea TaxID=1892477 RepID=A0ABP0DGS3_9PEZI